MLDVQQPTSKETSANTPSLVALQEQMDKNTFNLQYQQRTNNTINQIHDTMERLERMITRLIATRPNPNPPSLLGQGPGYPLPPVTPPEPPDGHHRFPNIRLELPKFDGGDPYGWIFRASKYFDFHDIPDAQHVRILGYLHMTWIFLSILSNISFISSHYLFLENNFYILFLSFFVGLHQQSLVQIIYLHCTFTS